MEEWTPNHIIEGDISELPIITAICFINAHFLVAAYSYHYFHYSPIRVWDLQKKSSRIMEQQYDQLEEVNSIYSTETALVTIGNLYIRVWDTNGLKLIPRFDSPISVAFYKTHPIIAYTDKKLFIEYENQKDIIDSVVQCLAFFLDGSHLMYIDEENLLTIRKTETKQNIYQFSLAEDWNIHSCIFRSIDHVAIATDTEISFLSFYPATLYEEAKMLSFNKKYSSATTMSMCYTTHCFIVHTNKLQLWFGDNYEYDLKLDIEGSGEIVAFESLFSYFTHSVCVYKTSESSVSEPFFLTWRPDPILFASQPIFHSVSQEKDSIDPKVLYRDADIFPNVLERYSWKKIKEPIPVMDWISGEEIPLLKRLESLEDLFYFWIPNMFCVSFTKEEIIQLKSKENIKYECKKIDTSLIPRLSNLNKKVPFLSLRSMGFGGGLLPLADLNAALLSKHRIFALSRTGKECVAIASLQMLSSEPDAVSADHCQKHSNDFIYTIRYVPRFFLVKTTKNKSKKKKKKSEKKSRQKRTKNDQK
jgi:hypothetical protein